MALLKSQVLLHCSAQAVLYNIEMTLGTRIKAARERLLPKATQKEIGDKFGITDQAVSSWERDLTVPELDKIPELARYLKVPCAWLLEGVGAPPPPNALEVRIEQLSPGQRAMLDAMIETLHKRPSGNVA
jgi:transcriptional regulator with XRE-family HTH domain